MKIYNTTDGHKIKKVGREKKIYFSENPYFVWNGRRRYFDSISCLTYPIMYEDDNGKTGVIGGYVTICNAYGVLIELLDGEAVQIWEEVEQ